jgi:hypothetical protein
MMNYELIHQLISTYHPTCNIPESSSSYLKSICRSGVRIIGQMMNNFNDLMNTCDDHTRSECAGCLNDWNLLVGVMNDVGDLHWLDTSLLNEILSHANTINLVILLNF